MTVALFNEKEARRLVEWLDTNKYQQIKIRYNNLNTNLKYAISDKDLMRTVLYSYIDPSKEGWINITFKIG